MFWGQRWWALTVKPGLAAPAVRAIQPQPGEIAPASLALELMLDWTRDRAPTAATRMTEELLPAEAAALLAPETITPGLIYLVSDDAPSRMILGAGAGSFAQTRVYATHGITLAGDDLTAETIAARFGDIANSDAQEEMADAFSQTKKYALNAAQARGLTLDWS